VPAKTMKAASIRPRRDILRSVHSILARLIGRVPRQAGSRGGRRLRIRARPLQWRRKTSRRELLMTRLPMIAEDKLTDAQRAAIKTVTQGKRAGVRGPF